ncbi:MAG: winged helix-turn-helix domain-containing protein [Xanthobacteraceae bacterium]|nr:winged helix-turn-helix domain-containing protein [Xanthobacteraceae bacterium]
MVLRFAGFELDQQRSELRGPDGGVIKLRPKTLGILTLLAANAGRVLSKQQLMDAVWPNVHVGDDSLFQCIREIRIALGDDRRQMVRLVSGQGYLFEAEVSVIEPPISVVPGPGPAPAAEPGHAAGPAPRLLGLRRPAAFAVAGVCAIAALAIVTTMVRPSVLFGRTPPTIAVLPITAADDDIEVKAMAANVTERLADGLAKIETIRVLAPSAAPQISGGPQADFVVQGELHKSEQSWEVRARMTRSATGEIVWAAPVSVMPEDADVALRQSRLAAGIGHPLALRIGELLNADAHPAATGRNSLPSSTRAAVEQAAASITQTSRERFGAAQTMLEKALAEDPDDVDLAVALAALQLRGIQMVWYGPAESAAARTSARSILERALRARPDSIPVLEAYCRFLSATNAFAESLVACARTLNLDPWDGMALYHIGLNQIFLGRFEDALATFQQADRFDTPQVSRWTWRLGAGWANLSIGRNDDAVAWLQRSIAITPASGRSYMLLAVAYHRLGRPEEAKAAMAQGMALRPGSTAANVAPPNLNTSEAYLEMSRRSIRDMVALGLPEG